MTMHIAVPQKTGPNKNFKYLQNYAAEYLNGYFHKGLEDVRFEEQRRIITSFFAERCDNTSKKFGNEPIDAQTLREAAKLIAIDVLELQKMFLIGSTDESLAVFGTARDTLWEGFPALRNFNKLLGQRIAPQMSLSCGGFDSGCLKELLSAYLSEPERKSLYGPALIFSTPGYQQRAPEVPVVAGIQGGIRKIFNFGFGSIHCRTPAIMVAANVLASLFFPGTWGTAEELGTLFLGLVNGSINQTIFSARNKIPHPIFLVDPKVNDTTFYDGILRQLALFSAEQPDRSAMVRDHIYILREDGIYKLKGTTTASSELAIEKVSEYGFENNPEQLIEFMIGLMDETLQALKKGGIIWSRDNVQTQIDEYDAAIKKLSEPLPDFPSLKTSHEILEHSRILAPHDAQALFKDQGWSVDPLLCAQEASHGSSYPGKPTSFGTVFKVRITVEGKDFVVYPTGANIAESGRDTNCAEKIAYGNLMSYLDTHVPKGATYEIESVHIHLAQNADFTFACSCQNCRQLFQNLVEEGHMKRSATLSYQAGKDSNVLVTTFDNLRPLTAVSKSELVSNDRYIPSSFELLEDPSTWEESERSMIRDAILCSQKSTTATGLGMMLMDGTTLSRAAGASTGYETLRHESKIRGKNIQLAFAYAVNNNNTDRFPTFPADQLDILLTAAQTSGFDAWVYVVNASGGTFKGGYRVRISELFPLGKGMGDSKGGEDRYHRLIGDRRWESAVFDGPIPDEIIRQHLSSSQL
jgi:hypothetical protein